MKYDFWKDKRITVTGGNGFLGTNVVSELKSRGAKNILITSHKKNDLRNLKNCLKVTKNRQIVFHLAGNVGGIGYNKNNPGSLFFDNLMMGVNMIEACRMNLVGKLVVVGTICSYPKFTPVPFKEENLWDGYPEETNAPYGIAKKSLITQGIAYREQYGLNVVNLLPVNLYGPGDHFDPSVSHVIPALIKKFVDAKLVNAKKVIVWGTGRATREFAYVKDAANAIVNGSEYVNNPYPINIGAGFEISIKELAEMIKTTVGYQGEIEWDTSKPDGQPRRMVDISLAKEMLKLKNSTTFADGLKKTVEWYFKQISHEEKIAD